jgi:hypothetical protein
MPVVSGDEVLRSAQDDNLCFPISGLIAPEARAERR